MTREEVTQKACSIFSLAYRSIGDFRSPCDGFCRKCQDRQGPHWTFENRGTILDYVRNAVVNQLKADGYNIAQGFDSITGEER